MYFSFKWTGSRYSQINHERFKGLLGIEIMTKPGIEIRNFKGLLIAGFILGTWASLGWIGLFSLILNKWR